MFIIPPPCDIRLTFPRIAAVRDEINKAGGCALSLVADTSKEDDIKQLLNTVHEKWGRIGIQPNICSRY